MTDILKSIFYQMKLGYFWKKVLGILLVFQGLDLMIDVFLEEDIASVSKAFLGMGAENIFLYKLVPLVFVIIASSEICGNDFMDKSINHEILSGHSRAQVYFPRAIMCVGVSIFGALVLMGLPMLLFSLAGYWGDSLEPIGMVIRIGLLLFVAMRLSLETVLLTMVIKNSMVAMEIGVGVLVAESVVINFFADPIQYFFGAGNASMLFDFEGWMTYSVKDLKMLFAVKSLPDATLISETILISLVVGVISTYIGYYFFKKDDLR